jgi:hypothetical protein
MPSFHSLLALALVVPQLAGAVTDEATELAGLNAQRAAVEQRFKAQSEVCAGRFFVNACLDEAKAVRKAELEPLQTREAAIDAKQRRARAEAQAQRVAERELEFAAAEGRNRTAELSQPVAASAAAPAPPKARPEPKQREQAAKSNQAQAEARRRQAQKASYQSEQVLRQQEAERRQALSQEKLKGKKPAMALPIPSAAEIAAAGSAASAGKR